MNVRLYKSPGASAVNLSFVIIDRAAAARALVVVESTPPAANIIIGTGDDRRVDTAAKRLT